MIRGDSNGPKDYVSGAQVVIDSPHAELHDGQLFFWSFAGAIGNGVTKKFLLVTPNTTLRAHFQVSVSSDCPGTWILYEGATTSNDGTSRTPLNGNRNSANIAVVTFFEDPTTTGNGTLVWTFVTGTTGNSSAGRVQSGSRADNEIVLKQNTKYLIQFTAGAAGNISLNPNWYEIT